MTVGELKHRLLEGIGSHDDDDEAVIYDQETGEFEDSRMNLIAIAQKVRRSQVQIEDRIY